MWEPFSLLWEGKKKKNDCAILLMLSALIDMNNVYSLCHNFISIRIIAPHNALLVGICFSDCALLFAHRNPLLTFGMWGRSIAFNLVSMIDSV